MKIKVGFRKVLLGSVCAMGLAITSQADAQIATYYDNNVMVDLTVLEDQGSKYSRPSIATPKYNSQLPPVGMPKSRLHSIPTNVQPNTDMRLKPVTSAPAIPTSSRIVLKKPGMMTTPSAMPASSTRIQLTQPSGVVPKKIVKKVDPNEPKPVKKIVQAAPKPVEAPKPVKIAAPKPAPVKVVKAKPIAAPAPAPKPKAKPVQIAKAKPVVVATPKPVEVKKAPAPVKAPAPAPKLNNAPPPPPPVVLEPKKVVSKMKKEAEKKAAQTAALTSGPEGNVRVVFQSGKSTLPAAFETELKQLAQEMRSRPDDRIQLLAYAGGESLSASKARRLSLSRALAVRSYLIDQGDIASTRIDVRALGNKTTEEPYDRVDVQISVR